jgi:hypothetical protein
MTVQWAAVANPTQVTVGDGAGGTQSVSIPNYASESTGLSSPTLSMYEFELLLLSYLNNVWGSTVGRGLGIALIPVVGSGNADFGVV